MRGFPREDQERIDKAIRALAEDPRPHGLKMLKGPPRGRLRIRVGVYRVIYTVEHARLLVLVLDVDHRKDAYE